ALGQASTSPVGTDPSSGPLVFDQTVQTGTSASVFMIGALDAGGESTQLFHILTDGTYVPLGPILPGFDIEGLDTQPSTGIIYGLSGGSGTQDGNLFIIDGTT